MGGHLKIHIYHREDNTTYMLCWCTVFAYYIVIIMMYDHSTSEDVYNNCVYMLLSDLLFCMLFLLFHIVSCDHCTPEAMHNYLNTFISWMRFVIYNTIRKILNNTLKQHTNKTIYAEINVVVLKNLLLFHFGKNYQNENTKKLSGNNHFSWRVDLQTVKWQRWLWYFVSFSRIEWRTRTRQ